MGFSSVFFFFFYGQSTIKEPGKTEDKGGLHVTMSKAGFVPRTVNGMPFNQGATRENLYTVRPIYNSTL